MLNNETRPTITSPICPLSMPDRRQSPSRALDGRSSTSTTRAEAETEFVQAIKNYQTSSGRMFPTWSEVLEVARALAYEQKMPAR